MYRYLFHIYDTDKENNREARKSGNDSIVVDSEHLDYYNINMSYNLLE